NAGHQPAVAIVRPAAAAPPRRPDPVEQHRAAETNKPKFSAPDSSEIGRASCREKSSRQGGAKDRRRTRPLFGATHLVGELPRSNGQPTAAYERETRRECRRERCGS